MTGWGIFQRPHFDSLFFIADDLGINAIVVQVNPNRQQMIKKIFGFLLGLGLIILFFYRTNFSWNEVISRILSSGWLILLGTTVFTAALYYVSAFKWMYILNDLTDNKRPSVFHLFHYTAMGYIFSFLLPRPISDVGVRSILLNRSYGVSLKTGAYSVLVDQLFNLMVSFLFVLPAIALVSNYQNMQLVLVLNLIEISLFFIIFWYFNKPALTLIARVYAWFIRVIYSLPFIKLKRFQDVPSTPQDFYISTAANRKLIIFSLIRQLPIVLRLYVIVVLLGLEIGFYYLLICSSVMLLLGLITIIPAQLGVGEWGWYGLLTLAGISDPDIVTFVLGARIYSNLSIIIIAALSWGFFHIYSGRTKSIFAG